MSRARVRVRALACALALGLPCLPRAALAWYFPEHVVITNEGLAQLPPEIRDVLTEAVSRARREGLPLCPRVEATLDDVAQARPLETRMIRSPLRVDCVPYAVLPALAGDHASSAAELEQVVRSPKGIEITSAAAYEWRRFEAALGRLPNESLERMSFVHSLDVALYFIDPGYELRAQATHAHFADGGRTIEERVRLAAATGGVEDALGQFLAHHERSLALAARGQASGAILEHAFAMHFLEDAFAAGHLVMTDETWKRGNPPARRRHDFYNALGLPVRYGMSVEPCPALGAGLELSGLPPCWVTTGDGYLGTSADASDRVHAARAATEAELELAMALDPKRVVTAVEAMGEREQLTFGQLVEPVPWWTASAADRRRLSASASRTVRLVRAEAAAVARLASKPAVAAVTVGGPPHPGLFDEDTLASALSPCRPVAEVDAAFLDADEIAPCGPGKALALGTVGVSLLRPLLVEWPAAQAEPSTLRGESKEDLGWAFQVLAAASAGLLAPARAPVDFFGPAAGASAGLSYRWGTYLPGRLDRPVAELNVGLTEALHYDSHGGSGASTHLTFLEEELRWPILWELLTSYNLPLDLAKGHDAGRLVFASGVRVRQIVTNPTPAFWGLELEIFSLALSQGRGTYPLYSEPPSFRLYLGAADSSAAQPSWPSTWGPTIGLELIGGYATLL